MTTSAPAPATTRSLPGPSPRRSGLLHLGGRHPRLAMCAAVVLALCGCNKDSATDKTDPAKIAEAEPALPAAQSPAKRSSSDALLEWLDPDAVAVVYSRLDPKVNIDTFAVVFAVPPKVERMLRDVRGVNEGLDAMLDAQPDPRELWLGPAALASTSQVSSGTYVLRPLLRTTSEVEALLVAAGMQKTEVEGLTMLLPAGAFRWKIALLGDAVAAFIPVKEIGSGLSPLTAGRDMPASAIEDELSRVLREDPSTVLEVYASGPLLHLDLPQDVLQFLIRARRGQDKGIDVELKLHPSRDPSEAATALSARDTSLETHKVQEVAKRVAFSVEGPVVVGRLEASAADVAAMSEGT